MEETPSTPDPTPGAGEEELGRLLQALTEGMTPEEAGKAREVLEGLFSLRTSGPDPWNPAEEIARRLKKAQGLSMEGRRRMLQEDTLALEVGLLGRKFSETALRVSRKEVPVTGNLKKETRRDLARLGQLNAVLVGRFPHLTPLLAEASDAYLDGMYILAGGEGPASVRLQRTLKERKEQGKTG